MVGAGDAVVFAGFIVFAGAVELAGFALLFPVLVAAGVAVFTGAGVAVLAGAIVLAGLLALFAVLLAASPQAIPKALRPRTVESTITFVILFRTPIFLKEYLTSRFQGSADLTQPFCLELFLIQGKRQYSKRRGNSQLKIDKKWQFLKIFFPAF